MKKKFALLMLAAAISPAFAQDSLNADINAIAEALQGKPVSIERIPGTTVGLRNLIYGTVSDDNGPIAGIIVTERNAHDRIMAQTTTDVNGNFSFRLVNPYNTIKIAYNGYETVDIPITKSHFEIQMKQQQPIPPIEIDPMLVDVIEYPTEEMINYWKYDPMAKNKPQDIYLPYRNNIRYGSIQELCDNLFLEL